MKQPCKLLHFLIIWGSVAANLVMTNSVLLLPADIAGVTFHGIDDPALHLFQGSGGLIPSVELSEDAHLLGVGRPHPEGAAALAVHLIGVGPKTPPCVAAAPLREGFQL